MPILLSAEAARGLRLRAQRLIAHPASTAAEAVETMVGVQAQEEAAAALALRPRTAGLTAAAVAAAQDEDRTLVRTWGWRSTLHLFATRDLGWLLPLYGPPFAAGGARRRAALGLDAAHSAQALHALRDLLGRAGPLTRPQIVAALAVQGVSLVGQAAPHLLGWAALQGIICLGPHQEGTATYVLLQDWVTLGPALPPAAAYAELIRRYLAAYGPATPQDMAAWSGLPLRDIRTAWATIADELLEVEIAAAPAWLRRVDAGWLDAPPPASPQVHLLPRYDIYLLGYRDRTLIVSPAHTRRINAGGGIVLATLVVDGQVAGTWATERRAPRLVVQGTPFAPLAPAVAPGLAAECSDLGRFLGVPTTLTVATPAS